MCSIEAVSAVATKMRSKPVEPVVFVVDDDSGVREYLQWLFESVGLPSRAFGSAAEFLKSYDGSPGCLLVDVRMPGLSGLDLQAALSEREIKIPIIIMTAFAEVRMAVRALKGGAMDFIEKPFDGQVLLDRVHEALETAARTHDTAVKEHAVTERLAHLTPRQREVLQHVMEGKPSKIIADELGLSPRTVDVHRARIMRAMHAESLADLLRMVLTVSAEDRLKGPPHTPEKRRRS